MELSEAQEIVKNFNEKNRFRDCGKLNSAIDTVLKALDNSISKDKVRKKIEEIDKQGDTGCARQMAYYFDDGTFVDKEGAIKILKQLLGE